MLLAYDAEGTVIATLDYAVAQDADGNVVGLIDFDAIEQDGGEMTEVWKVEGAVGSKTWPEWIGGRAHEFRVELDGPPGRKRIKALVHIGHPASIAEDGDEIPAVPGSGRRRERAAVAAAIEDRIARSGGGPADIRDLVGGPNRPLVLDDEGQTKARRTRPATHLPVIGIGSANRPTE